MLDEYLKSLAAEYLQLCELMASGEYDGSDYRELSSQRGITHNELIRVLGDEYARPFDMKAHCRTLVSAALTDTSA